jgi:hypothetical protein
MPAIERISDMRTVIYLRRLVFVCLLATLSGCGLPVKETQTAGLRQYLDDGSGLTVTSLAEPLVFAREQPMLAVHARDYVSLAPLELNNAGKRRYLIWLSGWSTIDHTVRPGADQDADELVYLMVDDEPMELKATRDPGLRREAYDDQPGAKHRYYAVTLDQLRRIAEAELLQLRFSSPGLYSAWRAGTRPWLLFVDATRDPALMSLND